jgi:putative sterol carrier protein
MNMSDVIKAAVEALGQKIGAGFDGSARFDISGEGSIRIDGTGVSENDSDADVVLTADTDTFRDILDGALDPTAAFMSGRLKIDGDMGTAMRLGSALA